jgi:tetratricopeptide (TPR) repeat protein
MQNRMTRRLARSPREKGRKQKRSRRLLLALALLSGLLLIAALGVSPGHRSVGNWDAEPPSLDWTGADPAVAAAVEAARVAVRQSPHSASAWGRLGMVLAAHDFATEANTCFQRAEQLDPHDGRWPYYQGTEFCLNDSDVAVRKLQRAAELLADRSEGARLRLGQILLRQGRLEEAADQFRRVLQTNPENGHAHLNLARIAREQGDLQVCLQHLKQSMKDVYTRKASHLLAAEVYQRLGDSLTARQERRLAAQLPKDPDWPDPLVQEVARLRTGKQARLADAARLLSQSHFQEAAVRLRAIVRDYPDSDWAWYLLGKSRLGQKDLPGAEAALRQAVQLAPASMKAQFYLGVALLLQDKPQAAAVCFRQAIAIQPDYAEAHHNLAHCLLRQGKRKEAIAAFRAALNCKPNYIPAHLDLAEALLQEGKNAEALAHARSAAELNRAEPRAKKLIEQAEKMAR